MERKLHLHSIYRHFKGNLYYIVDIAVNSETKERMVVYRAMYVRPYDMFMSEIDHVKYPKVEQKWRFEEIH